VSIGPDDKPRRATVTTPEPAPDGSVIVATAGGQMVQLNATAGALWALCDGATAVSEIITAATSFFAGAPDRIESDIIQTLEDLKRSKLIHLG
jgi:hypothetical protein